MSDKSFEACEKSFEDWMSNLKDGDKVTVNVRGWGYHAPHLDTVQGFTKTCVRVGGKLYNKSNGNQRDKYGSYYISPITKYVLNEIEENRLRNIINKELKVDKLSLEQLKELIEFLKRWER